MGTNLAFLRVKPCAMQRVTRPLTWCDGINDGVEEDVKRKSGHKNTAPDKWDDGLDKYSSVSICCTEKACPAAQSATGLRYLIDDAPDLPLAKCSQDGCTCSYASYRDRRSFLTNRRENSRLDAPAFKKMWRDNRREGADRRSIKVDFQTPGLRR